MVARIISNLLSKKTALPASGGAFVLDPIRRDAPSGANSGAPAGDPQSPLLGLPSGLSARKNPKAITQFLQQALAQYGHVTVLMEGVLEIKIANVIFLITLESNFRILRLIRKYNSEHFDLDEMRYRAQTCNINFRFVRTAFYVEPMTLFSDYEFFFDHERHPDQVHQVFRIFVTVTNEIDKTLHYVA